MYNPKQISQLIDDKAIPARIFPLPNNVLSHPIISKYITDNKQFKLIYAGRRAFKSEIAKRRIIQEAITHEGRRYIIGASTYTQTKLIYWQSLTELIPSYLIKKISESELKITLFNGSSIELFSVDSVERIEGGNPVSGCILDEASEYNIREVFNRNILPLLADLNGWCMILGVPRTTYSNEFREMVQQFGDVRKYPDWGLYTWSSEDILPEDVIKNFKSMTDSRSYATEYLGQFVDDQSGRAYFNWDAMKHVKDIPFTDKLPIHISLDFNVRIMSALFSQIIGKEADFLNVFDEVTDHDTNVYRMAPKIKEKLISLLGSNAQKHRVIFTGDYAGFSRTANSRGSSWDELSEHFKGWNIELKVPSSPRIDHRLSAVNARLMTADGQVHMSVNPKCVELIEDFKLVNTDDVTINKAQQTFRTHASDSIGYLISVYWKMRQNSTYNLS